LTEERRVKLLMSRLVLSLSLVGVLVLAGCGSNEKLEQVQKDRETMTVAVEKAANDIAGAVDKLKAENNSLRVAVEMQSRQIEDLSFQVRKLQEAAGVAKQKIEAEKAAASKGFGLWQYLIILLVIVVIVVILWRLLRPRPFEDDEDEDFSSFDDDFGFDDEEDFEDEDKDLGEGKDEKKD
jgi:outer membrane murein-binding lipoprotein Lpp